MTGVMPEPPVRKRIFVGSGVGRVKSPVAWSSITTVPGRASRTRWRLTRPSSIALTVIVMRPSARPDGEVIEYVRQRRTPSMSMPIRTYCPGT
jgi:hypothetical protein